MTHSQASVKTLGGNSAALSQWKRTPSLERGREVSQL
jgi:hypothetical protein